MARPSGEGMRSICAAAVIRGGMARSDRATDHVTGLRSSSSPLL